MQINIIDCTFRDGGYYNKWDFSRSLANKYMQSISDSGIRFVEIGYRRINYKELLGPFAFCKDSFLNSLKIPKKISLGLMVNIDDIKPTKDLEKLISQNFKVAKKSPIKFVRVATKFEDITLALNLSQALKKLGYFIFINLMQSSELGEEEFKLISERINKLNKPGMLGLDKQISIVISISSCFHQHNVSTEWKILP